jgi:hypothetical protein
MPNNCVRANTRALPNTQEPAFTVTDAGLMFLLLEDIREQAETASLPPAIVAELAALTLTAEAV